MFGEISGFRVFNFFFLRFFENFLQFRELFILSKNDLWLEVQCDCPKRFLNVQLGLQNICVKLRIVSQVMHETDIQKKLEAISKNETDIQKKK